jgi:hypothetical protein
VSIIIHKRSLSFWYTSILSHFHKSHKYFLRDQACSGGSPVGDASTSSISRGSGGSSGAASGPSGSASVSGIAGGSHRSFSHDFQEGGNCADTTCSGPK